MERKTDSTRNPRSRFERHRTAGLVLTERDGELLADLFLHRAMDRGQLQALYFGSASRCNARLRQLFDHGYVRRTFPEAAPYGARAVYTPGNAAIPLVADRLGMEEEAVRGQLRRSPTPAYLEHTLAIVDFRVRLMEAVRDCPPARVDLWLPELLCRHEYEAREAGGRWRPEVFRPDAFFRLKGPDEYHGFFLEVDRGNVSARLFAAKLDSYVRYRESGLFRDVYGEKDFGVLTVTSGERRRVRLMDLSASKEGIRFRFATGADVSTHGPLGRIWHGADGAACLMEGT